jgi:hypothetical protein
MTNAERQQRQQRQSAKCRVFRHEWEGAVFIENTPVGVRWVGRFECDCGTQRIDFMIPRTFELKSRRYVYPPDYLTDMDRDTAKKVLFTSMMVVSPENADDGTEEYAEDDESS